MRLPRHSARRAASRSRSALLARAFACTAVTAVVGFAWAGPSPVEARPAQVPGLPDPLAPPPEGTSTTTTVVPLPTIEEVVPAPSPSPSPTTAPPLLPELAPAPTPAPGGGAPAPAAAKGTRSPVTVRRSTVTDVPPSGRAAPPGYTRAGPATSSAAAPAEAPADGPYQDELPFATARAQRPAGGELRIGMEDGATDRVRNMASAAAGLIAVVLLGVVLWLRGQARPEPAPL